ncbi:hypothetical protein ABMA09_13965 [Erwinia rhapontici]
MQIHALYACMPSGHGFNDLNGGLMSEAEEVKILYSFSNDSKVLALRRNKALASAAVIP